MQLADEDRFENSFAKLGKMSFQNLIKKLKKDKVQIANI